MYVGRKETNWLLPNYFLEFIGIAMFVYLR